MKFVNRKLASAKAEHEKEEKRLKRKIEHVQRELEGERQRLAGVLPLRVAEVSIGNESK